MYEVKLGNGTTLKNVIIEGETFYTMQPITRDIFEYGLHEVEIVRLLDSQEDESQIAPGIYKNLKLVTCMPCRPKPGYYMFEFEEMTHEELREQEVDARLDYLEMITEE